MLQLIVMAAVFLFVTTVVLIIGFAMRGERATITDERFSIITGVSGTAVKSGGDSSLFANFEESSNPIEIYLNKHLNLKLFIEQADIGWNVPKLLFATIGLLVGGTLLAPMVYVPVLFAPLVGLTLAGLPIFYIWWMRGRRFNAFTRQLPEALDLIARALRSGHSLGSGINLVAEEMSLPISKEFSKVYESQNLGLPLEEALEELAGRMPNLDLRFFVTAVVLQRQTGGDLAEILDKIGHLVRERFKIWGEIQSLTGEGRLSAMVLLSLPPALFGAMFKMNPTYAMTLFTDPLGQKMLMSAIFLQLVGAYVIKKIIDIKV
jgi:tight adherence protein B